MTGEPTVVGFHSINSIVTIYSNYTILLDEVELAYRMTLQLIHLMKNQQGDSAIAWMSINCNTSACAPRVASRN